MNHMVVIFFPHEKVLFDVDFHFQCMSHGILKDFQKKKIIRLVRYWFFLLKWAILVLCPGGYRSGNNFILRFRLCLEDRQGSPR